MLDGINNRLQIYCNHELLSNTFWNIYLRGCTFSIGKILILGFDFPDADGTKKHWAHIEDLTSDARTLNLLPGLNRLIALNCFCLAR
jgi:hypothetical protein